MQDLQSMFDAEPRLVRAEIGRHVQKITLKRDRQRNGRLQLRGRAAERIGRFGETDNDVPQIIDVTIRRKAPELPPARVEVSRDA